ncbi:DNA recombination protein RmuC [Corynebacterium striatum]|uniref:DNA recombination protein RmuC n=1 Tax=Corynebacterium striatum TaxID=43770 RepID=UPI00254CA21D|nr:DNA recombination protein RmuC [Corynebacterium striatum]MDK8843319.1 DNA recombination protein RmuC [Corynebacterium striatum]
MSTALPVLLLFFGVILGAILGWLARAYSSSSSQPSAEHRALQESQRRQAELAPLEKAMDRLGYQLQELEESRATELAALSSQVQAVTRTSTRLTDRTDKLVGALRSPNVRGRWGEMQLERVVEIGGMLKHVDFNTQATARIQGATVRPDLVIHLAGGRSVIVDAKVPFSSYLDALETEDPEEHAGYLRRHAHMLRNHVQALAHRDYIEAFSPTPEFVVLFVPADPFLDAALSVDPELLEFAFERNIVIATPSTLFALLRTVALGWRHEDLSEKAREVQRLGRELYSRLGTLNEHYNKVGRSLEKAVEAYNSSLGSLDSRVSVTARRLYELEIPARTDRRPVEPQPVEAEPRRPRFED